MSIAIIMWGLVFLLIFGLSVKPLQRKLINYIGQSSRNSKSPKDRPRGKLKKVSLEIEFRCLVCREVDNSQGVVICKKCLTPCHEKCFCFVGKCSTYGCGGKKVMFIEKGVYSLVE